MVITYLIGNGFDLNIGLETSYKYFIENSYTKNINEEKREHIKKFKLYLKEAINKESNGGSNNRFEIDEWKDAELSFGEFTANTEIIKNYTEFDECYADFCDELTEYLRIEEKKLTYTNVFVNNFFDDIINFRTKMFNNQALRIQRVPEIDLKDAIVNFIDFNYTTIIDNLLSEKNIGKIDEVKFGELIHIHGDLDTGIILGVDNEGQISKKEIFNNHGSYSQRNFIKPQSIDMRYDDKKNRCIELIRKSDYIVIFGSSIGDTDRTWWNQVCEALRIDKHVIFTTGEELELSKNPNRAIRDFNNEVEKRKTDFVNKIQLNSYFNGRGWEPYLASAISHIYYANYNMFKNLKILEDKKENK